MDFHHCLSQPLRPGLVSDLYTYLLDADGQITFGFRQANEAFVVFQSSTEQAPSLYFTYPGYDITSISLSGPMQVNYPSLLDCSGYYGRRIVVSAAPPNLTS
jgi:hypothetical protein